MDKLRELNKHNKETPYIQNTTGEKSIPKYCLPIKLLCETHKERRLTGVINMCNRRIRPP